MNPVSVKKQNLLRDQEVFRSVFSSGVLLARRTGIKTGSLEGCIASNLRNPIRVHIGGYFLVLTLQKYFPWLFWVDKFFLEMLMKLF